MTSDSFRARLRRSILLPAGLLAFLAILLLWQIDRVSEASKWVLHTDEVEGQAHRIQSNLLDMETGMRGFLLGGRPEYLKPYLIASPKFASGFLELEKLVSDNSEQSARVKSLKKNFSDWMDYADFKIAKRKSKASGSKGFEESDLSGKALVDKLRTQFEEIFENERILLDRRTKAFVSAERQLVLMMLGGAFLFSLLIAYFSRRELKSLSSVYTNALHAEEERGRQLDLSKKRSEKASTDVIEILEGMLDGFLEVDAAWTIVRVNQIQEKIRQQPRQYALGKNLWAVFPDLASPTGKAWIENHRAMEERISVEYEDYYSPLDMWVERRVYPRSGGGVAIFIRDITHKKKAEEALRETVLALEAERAIREIFVSTLSHALVETLKPKPDP